MEHELASSSQIVISYLHPVLTMALSHVISAALDYQTGRSSSVEA